MNNIPKPAASLPFNYCGAKHNGKPCQCGLIWSGKDDCVVAIARSERNSIDGEGYTEEAMLGNAAYLVWAANNARALYELLSRVCKYLDDESDIEADSPVHADIAAALKAARGEA